MIIAHLEIHLIRSCARSRADYFARVLPSSQTVLDRTVASLVEALGANLCSCCVYGSAVRGNAIEGVSDINLLLVLRESTPAAHRLIGGILAEEPSVDPFILARRGFERSLRAFAPKFESIRRNYRVLQGEDLLAGMKVDAALERFLCEQAFRNLRLRLVYAFVTRARSKAYDRFVVKHTTPLFVQCTEILRLNGVSFPQPFIDRVPVIEKLCGVDGSVLRDLLAMKVKPRRLSDEEMVAMHDRLFPFVDGMWVWLETRWPV